MVSDVKIIGKANRKQRIRLSIQARRNAKFAQVPRDLMSNEGSEEPALMRGGYGRSTPGFLQVATE